MSSKKKILAGVVGVGALVFVGALTYALIPTATRDIGPGQQVAAGSAEEKQLIEAGRYVAVASDCIACHTAGNGKQYAGGRGIESPIGTMYATNITPDQKTGIGNYSLNDFDRAVRHGIKPGGGTLYPSMPYPSYAKMSDGDLRALYVYFMKGVAPVAAENRASDIPWPLSIRWPLSIWRKQFAPEVAPIDAGKYADANIARGAYLVQSLGHCGSCHTPRSSTMSELALDESGPEYLSGGPLIDGWLAVNLRGDKVGGMGDWSQKDIVDTLKSARNSHTAVVGGPMNDVVSHSTQHMTDADLNAMAAYLKTLPATGKTKSTFAASDTTAKELFAGIEKNRGAQLYLDNCAACHRTDGKSNRIVFPALPGNPTVLSDDPTSLIRVVLAGSRLPSTKTAPSDLGMPGFAWRLSDDETAQLVTFVRQSWGNDAAAATASDVKKVRGSIDEQELKAGNVTSLEEMRKITGAEQKVH